MKNGRNQLQYLKLGPFIDSNDLHSLQGVHEFFCVVSIVSLVTSALG